jgi:peptidoglycan-N-acetylglucosamine deacetylase
MNGSFRGLIAAAVLCASGFGAAASAQEIALTFDDLPAHSALPAGETRVGIIAKLVAALSEAGAPPTYGFINGVQLEREPDSAAVLPIWRAAGHPVGNHTWSHINLNDHDVEAFTAEILKNEPLLKAQAGDTDWRWFRYPFLSEGTDPKKRQAVREFLAKHRYRVASVTMSFNDYAWNEPYARCVAKGDEKAIAALETGYLDAAKASLKYSSGLSNTLYGRDIPYVLLMHAGAFDARMLPRLLALYRSHGVRFVTLEAAEKDPFYRDDLETRASPTPATLEAEMARRQLPLPARGWSLTGLDQVCR